MLCSRLKYKTSTFESKAHQRANADPITLRFRQRKSPRSRLTLPRTPRGSYPHAVEFSHHCFKRPSIACLEQTDPPPTTAKALHFIKHWLGTSTPLYLRHPEGIRWTLSPTVITESIKPWSNKKIAHQWVYRDLLGAKTRYYLSISWT